MTKRESDMCYDIASYLCYPSAIGIGGTEWTLLKILKNITVGRDNIRNEVLSYCEVMVDDGSYSTTAYKSSDFDEVMSMIKEDYKIFYNN